LGVIFKEFSGFWTKINVHFHFFQKGILVDFLDLF